MEDEARAERARMDAEADKRGNVAMPAQEHWCATVEACAAEFRDAARRMASRRDRAPWVLRVPLGEYDGAPSSARITITKKGDVLIGGDGGGVVFKTPIQPTYPLAPLHVLLRGVVSDEEIREAFVKRLAHMS
ncbi:hypothetical protein [Nocardioides ultimimeridianus]